MADDLIFWSVLATALVGIFSFVYLKVLPLLRASEEDHSLLTDSDEIELPDRSKFESLVAKKPDASDAQAFEKWQKKAAAVLRENACVLVKLFFQARADAAHYEGLKKGAAKLGFMGVTDEMIQSAQESFESVEAEMNWTSEQANKILPGQPGWGAAIFQEATDVLRARRVSRLNRLAKATEARQKALDAGKEDVPEIKEEDEDDGQDAWLVTTALRFPVGSRVQCNLGPEKGFVNATILSDWCLPYNILLDTMERCNAPADVDQLVRALDPKDDPKKGMKLDPRAFRLWNPIPGPMTFRFNVGDKVIVNVSNSWRACVVKQKNWRMDEWPPNQRCAYQVQIEGTSYTANVPVDHPNLINPRPDSAPTAATENATENAENKTAGGKKKKGKGKKNNKTTDTPTPAVAAAGEEEKKKAAGEIPMFEATKEQAELFVKTKYEYPDRSRFEAMKKKEPNADNPASPENQKWRQEISGVLMKVASDLLPIFYQKAHELKTNPESKKAQEAVQKVTEAMQWTQTQADEVLPGMPGWGAAIFQEAIHVLRTKRAQRLQRVQVNKQAKEKGELSSLPPQLALQKGDDDDSDAWLAVTKLKYTVGQRVKCNMGATRGWEIGTVIGDWNLPYQVLLDTMKRCTAPSDSDALIKPLEPAEDPKAGMRLPPQAFRLWNPTPPKMELRFDVGDKVAINAQGRWIPGVVVKKDWRQDDWPPSQKCAYQIKIEGTNPPQAANVPVDHPSLIQPRQ